MTDRLLELQDLDTAVDRLEHRRATLPERAALDAAIAAQRDWDAERRRLQARLDELGAVIDRAEAESAEIDRDLARLQTQLRTVIAPREAEALQREMATLQERRGGLDDRGLEALEEQAAVDDTLVDHLAREPEIAEMVRSAEAVCTGVLSEIDAQEAALVARRGPLCEGLDASVMTRYDRLRAHLGVAVARLVGHRCDGCHLDLSPAEVDLVKDVAPDSLAACPQCDRILVR